MIDTFGDGCFFGEGIEEFQFSIFLVLVLLYAVYEISNIINIVPEEYACEKGDDDDKKGLNGIVRVKVTKTNSKNDGGTEVVTPNILLVPCELINAIGNHPVFLWIDI